jgi:hypothetical protein
LNLHGAIRCTSSLLCSLNGANARRVVWVEGTSGEVLLLSGIRVIKGKPQGVAGTDRSGGGIFIRHGSNGTITEFVECAFENNYGDVGAVLLLLLSFLFLH